MILYLRIMFLVIICMTLSLTRAAVMYLTLPGFMYELPQLCGDTEDGDSEHDAVLHTRGQSCRRG